MKFLKIAAALALSMVMISCTTQPTDRHLLNDTRDGDTIDPDQKLCFARLAPAGELSGQKFSAAQYSAGACGDSQGLAVYKSVLRPYVLVQTGNEKPKKSALYLGQGRNDKKVYVKQEGEKVLVGTLVHTEDGTFMELDDKAEIDLRVGKGSSSLLSWIFGDWQSYKTEEIYLYL